MTQEEYRKAAVDAVKQLAEDVGIPKDLKEIVKREDLDFLAQSAYDGRYQDMETDTCLLLLIQLRGY